LSIKIKTIYTNQIISYLNEVYLRMIMDRLAAKSTAEEELKGEIKKLDKEEVMSIAQYKSNISHCWQLILLTLAQITISIAIVHLHFKILIKD